MHFQKPMLGVPLDWEHPFNKDLVMHLAMNEGHGDVVRDLSMNGNHGTVKNMAFPPTVASGWNPGQTGIGLNFDGSDDVVNCGHDPSLDISSHMTVSVMVNPIGASAGATPGIISKRDNGWGLIWLNQAENFVSSRIWQSDSTAINPDGFGITHNTWHIITLIANRENVRIYMDGVEKGTAKNYDGTIKTGTSDLLVGQQSAQTINGTVDQVRIHNRALTAKEVLDYYINPWQVYLDEDDD